MSDSDLVDAGTEIAKNTARNVIVNGGILRPGTIVRTATKAAVGTSVALAAKKAAEKYGDPAASKREKKLIGPIFYIMLTLAIGKDLFDLVSDVTVVFSWLSLIIEPVTIFIFVFYYFMNGVSFNTRKVVTTVISFIVGWIPLLSLLPETTLNLILIRWMENSELAKKGKKAANQPTTGTQAEPEQETTTETESISYADTKQPQAKQATGDEAQESKDKRETVLPQPEPGEDLTKPLVTPKQPEKKQAGEGEATTKNKPQEEKVLEENLSAKRPVAKKGEEEGSSGQESRGQVATNNEENLDEESLANELGEEGVLIEPKVNYRRPVN